MIVKRDRGTAELRPWHVRRRWGTQCRRYSGAKPSAAGDNSASGPEEERQGSGFWFSCTRLAQLLQAITRDRQLFVVKIQLESVLDFASSCRCQRSRDCDPIKLYLQK